MMKNILNSIKEKISKHKKVSILVLLLFLLIGGSIGYVLVTNYDTNSNLKVTQTNNQNKNPDTNATGSKDDKKNEVKEDKKEDKKVETTVEETKTTNVENNTTSTSTENNNSTNNTTSNTVSNTAKPTSTPCVPTYTTVNHPEQGHYETQVVSQAWDEPVYARKIVGGHTGRVYNSLDEFDNQDEDGNYSVKDVQVDTIHHDAVTQQVWVVDQQAWTETVASGC
jgi:hypothetical protein